ncbi:MAG: hypothetical protein Q9218_004503 [Villophora microphyllina]
MIFRTLFPWSDATHESNELDIGIQESRGGLLNPTVPDNNPNQPPSLHEPHYSDDPNHPSLPLQEYVSHLDGRSRALRVQAASSGLVSQAAENWMRLGVSSHADLIFRLATWTTSSAYCYPEPAYKVLIWLAMLLKAALLSPIYPFLIWRYVNSNGLRSQWRSPLMNRWTPITEGYPKFLGRCQEPPKHAPSNLGAHSTNPRTRPPHEDNQLGIVPPAREQKRLYRPRRLFVKMDDSWTDTDGDSSLHAEKPYVFISYAANQFPRILQPSGELRLTEEASMRLKQRAIAVAEQKGCHAFWIDFLTASTQPERTDDVHRFCDVVRSAKLVCVLLAEDKDMGNSLAMFGKRLWCLTECLLAPRNEIYVEGGGNSETIDIMQLPGRAWTKEYKDDHDRVIQGNGSIEEFRLLAEYFSGSQPPTAIQLFSAALNAMRALEFNPFSKGDMAYALMALLTKRPAMDDTDSEQQALARLCLFNNSDRLLERIICVLPARNENYRGWFITNDFFTKDLENIEPKCQVAGICDDEAIIIDGCHGISITWGSIPRISFTTRKTAMQNIILSVLWSSSLCIYFGFVCFVAHAIAYIMNNKVLKGHSDITLKYIDWYSVWGYQILGTITLCLGFLAPFCIRWIFGGEILEVRPDLIGIEGTIPIEQLERMAFGITGKNAWLEYRDFSGRLSSRNGYTWTGDLSTIHPPSLPAGHRIFTLLDTASFPPLSLA